MYSFTKTMFFLEPFDWGTELLISHLELGEIQQSSKITLLIDESYYSLFTSNENLCIQKYKGSCYALKMNVPYRHVDLKEGEGKCLHKILNPV